MFSTETVPEADRQEQREPPVADTRAGQPHPIDQPDADVLEQQLWTGEPGAAATGSGIDAEREEPDDDWREERRVDPSDWDA